MKIKQCFKYGLLSLGSILTSLSLSVKAEDKMSESVLTQVKDVPTQIAALETRFHEIKGLFTDNPETYKPKSEILDLYRDLETQIEIVNLFIKSDSALDGSKITKSMINRMSDIANTVKELISQKERGHYYLDSEMTEAVYLVFTKEIEEILKELI